MIPWANFDTDLRNDIPGDIRVQLHEHWLAWVEEGSTMKTYFLDSPMLEIAHERQFVVSQQGGNSTGFEDEHTKRIAGCVKHLGDYFQNFACDEPYRPASPNSFDLRCCWKPDVQAESLSPFQLSQSEPSSVSQPSPPPKEHQRRPVPSLAGKTSPIHVRSTLDPACDDMSDDEEEHLREFLRAMPRANSTNSNHAVRSQKGVRQRKKYDSKFANDVFQNAKKRSFDWVSDQHEDEMSVAVRSRSIASLRQVYQYPDHHIPDHHISVGSFYHLGKT